MINDDPYVIIIIDYQEINDYINMIKLQTIGLIWLCVESAKKGIQIARRRISVNGSELVKNGRGYTNL